MYQAMAEFSRTAGLLFLLAMFVAVFVYVMWPGSKRRFEDASQIPLRKD